MEVVAVLLVAISWVFVRVFSFYFAQKRCEEIYLYIVEEIPSNTWFTFEELTAQKFYSKDCRAVLYKLAKIKDILVRNPETKEDVNFSDIETNFQKLLQVAEEFDFYEFKYVGKAQKRRRRKFDWSKLIPDFPKPVHARIRGVLGRLFSMSA